MRWFSPSLGVEGEGCTAGLYLDPKVAMLLVSGPGRDPKDRGVITVKATHIVVHSALIANLKSFL